MEVEKIKKKIRVFLSVSLFVVLFLLCNICAAGSGSGWMAAGTDLYLAWDNAVADHPIAGDWNADGKAETGVYRPGVGFYLKMDNSNTWNPLADQYLTWDNAAEDLPIAGDWNAVGSPGQGYIDPVSGSISRWTPVPHQLQLLHLLPMSVMELLHS